LQQKLKNMKTLKLAFIGECMIELQETAPGVTKQTFGGDTLNTAIYCARLARDLPLQVDYVTALGQDSFSERMVHFWELEGVGSELVQRFEGELPGLYYIEIDNHGERIFYYWRSAAAVKKCFEYPDSKKILEKLGSYGGVYISGISLAVFTPESLKILISRLNELARLGVSIYFDCNYRPYLWKSKEQAIKIYEQLYRISNIVFLTTEEAGILLDGIQGEKIHKRLQQLGVGESVLKDGENPCTIFWENELFEVPAQKMVKVIDTTAAGDSFSAIYLVARCFGCSPANAAKMAHKAAAYVVCYKGAIAPIELMPVTGLDISVCIDS